MWRAYLTSPAFGPADARRAELSRACGFVMDAFDPGKVKLNCINEDFGY
jgi:hypothetical protein